MLSKGRQYLDAFLKKQVNKMKKHFIKHCYSTLYEHSGVKYFLYIKD